MKQVKPLPNPLQFDDGSTVQSDADWQRRRSEIQKRVIDLQYGTVPGAPEWVDVTTTEKIAESNYTCQHLNFVFTPAQQHPDINFGLQAMYYRPTDKAVQQRQREIPAFAAQGLPLVIYVGDNPKLFPVLLKQGYAVLSYHNARMEPMVEGDANVGPARQAYRDLSAQLGRAPDRSMVKDYTWGSIGVWAWGALRLLDFASQSPEISNDHIAVSGHSRNGKTALLAAALDERFTLVNPAGSGCGGAGSYLVQGDGCEDIKALTDPNRWWSWMHRDFGKFANNEINLPFDQHFLMSLIAPRPLLRTEGMDDHWANPLGTAALVQGTQPVYDFLGAPAANAVHMRDGGHYQGQRDFTALYQFCDQFFFNTTSDLGFSQLPEPILRSLGDVKYSFTG